MRQYCYDCRRVTAKWIVGVSMLAFAVVGPQATSPRAQSSRPVPATATFAGGCFWCLEEALDKVVGVLSTTSGYTGGRVARPTYEQVSSGGTGHLEAVQVAYDPQTVSYDALLDAFWRNIDPFDGGGQFCDRGEQYQSAIFYHSPEQQQQAEASKARVAARLRKPLATRIVAAGPFFQAEEYHQDYYKRNAVRYRFYKWNCGRAQRLEDVWGKPQ